MIKIVFWLAFAATLTVYLIMVSWSLPRISDAAGGLPPFDLRPTGYSYQEAQNFLAAISPQGNAFYRNIQHRLDLVYPALLATALFLAILLLAPARPSWLGWLLALTAVPGAIFDWLENAAVTRMLLAGPDRLTPQLADQASRWTLLKSAFSTLAMTILLVLLIVWVFRRIAARQRAV